MFRDMNLSHRFAVLIGIVAAGFIAFGIGSFMVLSEVKVKGPVYDRIVADKDLVADTLPPPLYILESNLVVMQLLQADRAQQGPLAERLKTLRKEYDQRHEYWQKQGLGAELDELLLKKAHAPAMEFYDRAFKELIPALDKQDKAAAALAVAAMTSAYDKHRAAIDAVVKAANTRSEADETASVATIESSTRWLIFILAASLSVSVALAIVIARTMLRQLGGEPRYAADVVSAIGAGDLTLAVATRAGDDASMLASMKKMQQNLTATVTQIKASAETISSASGQIASGNADLSQRTEEQASSLEETASSLEELTGTVKQNAENAKQANQLAAGASSVAVRGGEVVNQVVSTMSGISESSKKIADIIGVIDGIAFQTNILALNASVEAARAGEQGRGFAVVATEVRNLAQRSAAAAKEIKELIGDSTAKVDQGSKLVDEAGRTMEEIVTSVKRVTDIMAEISASSHEQASGIEQVNTAITQMDQVTQQNAALVEQAAAAAESMRDQAHQLANAVAVFKLSDGAVAMPSATVQKIAAAAPQVERRSPNRAKNVTRLPARTSTAVVPAAKAVGSDVQEWEEF